ncbi:MAG: hypothetical protein IAF38_16555 [Bacteroidia bacterium]|nr:hypothetical protein [Bacteroidia bacterium]
MKSNTFKINIADPCSQKWEEMTPTGNGRFCDACTKVVVDFTQMTNEELIEFYRTSTKKVCGRYRASQLNKTFTYSVSVKNPWYFNSALLKFSLAGLLTFSGIKGFSQNKTKAATVSTPLKSGTSKIPVSTGQVSPKKNTQKILIKVIDQDGKPLSTAKIEILKTKKIFFVKNGSAFISIPRELKDSTFEIMVSAPPLLSQNKTINVSEISKGSITVTLFFHERIFMGQEDQMIPENSEPKKINEDGK